MSESMLSHSLSLIFDLDGTLIDSRPGIASSLQMALSDAGQDLVMASTDVPVGPPLVDLIKLITGSDDRVFISFIEQRFRFHYDSSGYKQSQLFVGVYKLLESLYSCSVSLYIATNKRLKPTLRILDSLSIAHFFKDVYAVDSCEEGYQSKSKMLKALLSHHSVKEHAVYIGDRYDDFDAATENSLAFRFPAWGYANEHYLFPVTVTGVDLCPSDRIGDLLFDLTLPGKI